MQDRELYQQILGIRSPWRVAEVKLEFTEGRVLIRVEHAPGERWPCPTCGEPCAMHDHRRRRWRHLDTCQLETTIEAEVPRIRCGTHGVLQVPVPWAEPGSGFTSLFEALVITWLQHASLSAVAERLRVSWDQVDGIMGRAVRRGLARRPERPVRDLGLDETAFQRRHEYVTVLTDRERGTVVEVLDDRTEASLRQWLQRQPIEARTAMRSVSLDMWKPYIRALTAEVPGAATKLCFDRFHVAQHFGRALDQVRAAEHRAFQREHGESPLRGTKHDWLRNAGRLDNRARREFMALTRRNLRTARAWAIKETAASLWHYRYRGAAERAWHHLLGWIARCRLAPVQRIGRMLKTHLWGVLNAIIQQVSNAKSESMNARIQKLKAMACGFRSRERMRRAILFHLGGLDLLPDGAKFAYAHTES
jgi:transposase